MPSIQKEDRPRKIFPDTADPVVPHDAPIIGGADDAPMVPGDTAPGSGWHLGISSGIMITQLSSSDT